MEQQGYTYNSGPERVQSYLSQSATPKPTVPALPNYDLEPLEEDAILTFGQTVDQLQQQGGRDLSRYPAVTELYDKANGLRPKLVMSLTDAGRKERKSLLNALDWMVIKIPCRTARGNAWKALGSCEVV